VKERRKAAASASSYLTPAVEKSANSGEVEEDEEDEETAAARAEEEACTRKFHGDGGVFYHTFTSPVSVDYDMAFAVCAGSVESSLSLAKQGEDAQLLLLPLDLSPFIAAERQIEVWCALENTELSRAPYNLKGFTLLLCSGKDVLSQALRKELNPLRITLVRYFCTSKASKLSILLVKQVNLSPLY
jgi:hypothetical protein